MKNLSKSGCAKKVIDLLFCIKQLSIFGFLGAGGQVTISGILYLSDFGVEQISFFELLLLLQTSSSSTSPIKLLDNIFLGDFFS